MEGNQQQLPEVWMRGPIEGVPTLLQPVAHALLQVQEDVEKYTKGLQNTTIWQRPANVASIAFHLQHIVEVLDRMFTYASDLSLSNDQLYYLQKEGVYDQTVTLNVLRSNLDRQLQISLEKLKEVDINTLTHIRYLGRKRIPTSLISLLFHAAEHAQRHLGQLLVTAIVLRQEKDNMYYSK